MKQLNLLSKKKFLVFSILLLSSFISNSTEGEIDDCKHLSNQENGRILTIVTRHATTITNKFESEFLATQTAQDLGISGIDFLQATTDEGWQTLLNDSAKGVDLAWGGTQGLFNKMDKLGLLLHIDNSSLVDYVKNNINLNFNHFISMDENNSIIWTGNALHTFGIIVNQEFLEENNLEVPSKFENLANESYYISSKETIKITDPPLSTSHIRIYQIILQTYGWEEGWSILTRIGGNAGFNPVMIPDHEPAEEIRLAIDFYGMIAKRENPNTQFILPDDCTVDTNPVALGINVDDQEAAEAFLQFIFSPEGQAIWLTEGLDRLPINEQAFKTAYGQTKSDLYELFNKTKSLAYAPFNETLAELTEVILAYYFHYTITENHGNLRKTWGEMVNQLRDEKINKSHFLYLVKKLGKVNLTLEEAIAISMNMPDSIIASLFEEQWGNYARDKYEDIYCDLTKTCISETDLSFFQPYILITTFLLIVVIKSNKKKKFLPK